MLILVYLVFMLSQTDSVSLSENSGVYPIESSQKLMLTIPTELPSDYSSDNDSLYSTTESLESVTDNLISKNDNMYIGTDPLIPMQEPTTTPMSIIDEIQLENEILPEEIIGTFPHLESTTEEELSIPTSTEEIITEDINAKDYAQQKTTPKTIIVSIPIPSTPQPPLPIKRSLTLDADAPKIAISTAIETTTEPQVITTTQIVSLEETTENDQTSTDLPLSENSSEVDLVSTTSSSTSPTHNSPPPISEDSLFKDNWANHLSEENEGYNIELNDENLDFIKEPTKSLFQNEDSELTPTESSILNNELNDSTSLSEHKQQLKSVIENTSPVSYSDAEDSQPMFSPQNLLNLFTFDHQPSASNLKPTTWWPKSKSSSMSFLAENAAKNQKKRGNRISRNDNSQETIGNQRTFNTLFNRKLKNSVNILERWFGNYFLQ